jgi:peptidoglycan biosynthesis protein MviN/MurJ (putative lipid II flippase)
VGWRRWLEEPVGTVAREDIRVAQAAGMLSLGNFASRVLGLVREMVKAPLFGSGGDVSALDAALRIPTMIYDLLVGGVLSSAFVPIFHDYAAPEHREELWRLLSVLVSITLLILSAVVLVGELLAPQLIKLQAGDLSPVYREMAVNLLRLALPAVVFTSLASVLSGALYALKRFTFPAFIGAVANAAIIATALLLERYVGLSSMAIGTLVGAVLQVAILLRCPNQHLARPAPSCSAAGGQSLFSRSCQFGGGQGGGDAQLSPGLRHKRSSYCPDGVRGPDYPVSSGVGLCCGFCRYLAYSFPAGRL